MSATDQTLATPELFNEAFNRHDVDAVMKLTTEDIVFENTSGERFEGQEAVHAVFLHLGLGQPNRSSIGTVVTRSGALLIAAALVILAIGLI